MSCIAIQENRKFTKEVIFLAFVFNETLRAGFFQSQTNKEIILIHMKHWSDFTYMIPFKFYNNAVKVCRLSIYTFNMTKINQEVVN